MTDLSAEKCIPCRAGTPPLDGAEIAALMPSLPSWEVVEQGGVLRLQRIFKFKDYARAVTFTNQVAAIAEQEHHHPLMVLEWGKVTVQWWTHAVKGLHKNDFIMAAKTDALFAQG